MTDRWLIVLGGGGGVVRAVFGPMTKDLAAERVVALLGAPSDSGEHRITIQKMDGGWPGVAKALDRAGWAVS